MTGTTALAIANAIEHEIRAGVRPPGSKLPSQNAFALKNGVHRVTVARAYDFLKDRGLVVARRGSGTFVHDAATIARALARRDPPS